MRIGLIIALLATTAHGQIPAVCEIHAVQVGAGGSGGLIAKGEGIGVVITAYHVVEGTPRYGRVDVSFPELQRVGVQRRMMGKLLSMNSVHDIAIVVVNDDGRLKHIKPVTLATRKPSKGDWVCSQGFPSFVNSKRGQYRELTGTVTRFDYLGIRTSCEPHSGQSGALLVDRSGDVIGLVNGYTVERGKRVSWGPHGSLLGGPILDYLAAVQLRFGNGQNQVLRLSLKRDGWNVVKHVRRSTESIMRQCMT